MNAYGWGRKDRSKKYKRTVKAMKLYSDYSNANNHSSWKL